MHMRHRVVMVATSYPRFPGDNVGTFMEPIAHGVAARGHEVHLVAPWHPAVTRPPREGGVHFHFFRYAPLESLNVFGYAGALRADVQLRWSAYLAAPLALAAGWRAARAVARRIDATVVHGHWVIPGGAIAMAAAGSRPLVVSLHGSDVYVAERSPVARRIARRVFDRAAWVTACSEDLRRRAMGLGARGADTEVVPYGVDTARFRPDKSARARVRAQLGIEESTPLVVTAGRFVRKKGFEYLLDAVAPLAARLPGVVIAIAGDGDLAAEYRARAAAAGVTDRVRFPGLLGQDEVGAWFAAADAIAVPSVRDDTGNVDGLPNVLLEALASATPVVATPAGGIGAVVTDGRTGVLVPERDAASLARALFEVLADRTRGDVMGRAAREDVDQRFGWGRVAGRLEAAYDCAAARGR
jgi:glycosyltransferase involved in cell wall biosynthesis